MKDLSIIIHSDEKEIKKCIKLLEPLLQDFDTELILMMNQSKTIDMPFSYTYYNFNEGYSQFKNFCFESSLGKRVMIIEKGILLTLELIKAIHRSLENDDYLNISCNLKTYINDDQSLFFVREKVLVYNRGIKGFNKDTGITVEDFSLLSSTEIDIEMNVEKLLKGKYYDSLYLWYENSVIKMSESFQTKFYTTLEMKKAFILKRDILKIENLFLQLTIRNKYWHYLDLKKRYSDAQNKCSSQLVQEIKNIGLVMDDVYYCWILKEFILSKDHVEAFLKAIGQHLQKVFLNHLFEYDNHSCHYIHSLIIDRFENVQLSTNCNCDLTEYLSVMLTYIEFMKDKSEDAENKKKLIKVVDLYLDYSENLPENTTCSENAEETTIETTYFTEFYRIKSLITNNKITEAFSALEDICENFPQMLKVTRYYMQKLRYEHESYSCVLSICMIVKDEEKNLDRCLSSLKPLADSNLAEIIIVDTGSKDSTMNIAKKYTDKIYSYPWTGNFSEARNYSTLFASGEYIVTMDADEEFRSTDINKIIKEFSGDDYKNYNTLTLRLISYTDPELKGFAVLTQPRIFRNTGLFYYSSSIHNQPILESPIQSLDIEILHYGYIMTEDIREKKFQRTATLLKKELEKNPRNLYYRFQLSSSYAMYGDLKEALKHVEIYMRTLKEDDITGDIVLMYYNSAATLYLCNYEYDEVEKISDEALAIQPDFIDFVFYKAIILFNREAYYEALVYINRYLDLIDHYFRLPIANDGRFSFYTLSNSNHIIRLFISANYRLGNYTACLAKINALEDDYMLKNCLHEVIGAAFRAGEYSVLAKLYAERIEPGSDTVMKDIFIYFLLNNLFKCSAEENSNCLSVFETQNDSGKLIEEIKFGLKNEKFHREIESLAIFEKYDMDEMDLGSAQELISKIYHSFKNFIIEDNTKPVDIRRMKKVAQVILHRTEKLMNDGIISIEEVVGIFQKYMDLCSTLLKVEKAKSLEAGERLFIAKVLLAMDALKANNYKDATKYLKSSVDYYHQMSGFIDLALQILVPEFSDQSEAQAATADKVDSNHEASQYSSDLKEELLLASETSLEPEKALLELFEKYNKTEYYDADLYALKSTVLLSQKGFEDAEAFLAKGLKKFPEDSHIIRNLYKLHVIKQDYTRAIEVFCKTRMRTPKTIFTANDLVPQASNMQNSQQLRVLHGSVDLTKRITTITEALRDKGIYVKSLNYIPKHIGYSSDYIMDVNLMDSGSIILDRTIDAASKLISRFDVFHFHYGMSLEFNHSDLCVLNELKKKVLMHFWGQDVRMHSKAAELNPYYPIQGNNDDEIKRKLEKMSKYISCCVISNAEVNEYVKEYFSNVKQISPMFDVNQYKPDYINENKKKIIILHAPSSQESKGTKYIIQAIDDLKLKYNIDFRLVQNTLHERAIQLYRDADLIIDQVLLGSYGQLSIEAMALGKPVICWISDFMKENYPKELPIISANPQNIREKIEYVLNNRDILYELGIKGRLFVEKYHNIDTIIPEIIDLYET